MCTPSVLTYHRDFCDLNNNFYGSCQCMNGLGFCDGTVWKNLNPTCSYGFPLKANCTADYQCVYPNYCFQGVCSAQNGTTPEPPIPPSDSSTGTQQESVSVPSGYYSAGILAACFFGGIGVCTLVGFITYSLWKHWKGDVVIEATESGPGQYQAPTPLPSSLLPGSHV